MNQHLIPKYCMLHCIGPRAGSAGPEDCLRHHAFIAHVILYLCIHLAFKQRLFILSAICALLGGLTPCSHVLSSRRTTSTCTVQSSRCPSRTAGACSVQLSRCPSRTAGTCSVQSSHCPSRTTCTSSVQLSRCPSRTAGTCSVQSSHCPSRTTCTSSRYVGCSLLMPLAPPQSRSGTSAVYGGKFF